MCVCVCVIVIEFDGVRRVQALRRRNAILGTKKKNEIDDFAGAPDRAYVGGDTSIRTVTRPKIFYLSSNGGGPGEDEG